MSTSTTSPDTLRVGLVQCHVTEQKEENHATVTRYIREAASQGAQLVVLPEIWNSPYATTAFPDYAETIGTDWRDTSPSAQLLAQLAEQHTIWLVGGSIPEIDDGNIYNTSLIFNPKGELVARHRKVHLFDIDVPGGITFFESDTLSPGQSLTSFQTDWGTLGAGICYDIRFPHYSMVLRQETGCPILIFPGCFNMTTGPAHWELLQRARAVDNQCFVLTASQARATEGTGSGKYPHYTAWGHSTIVDPWGTIVATTDETEGLVVADLDLTKVASTRASIPISKQQRDDLYKLDRA